MAPGIIKIIYGVSKWTQDESGRGVRVRGEVGPAGKRERGEREEGIRKGHIVP